MNTSPRMLGSTRSQQRGVGIIETMVGLLIGLVVVLVIYNTLIVAEAYKRSTIGISDAQVTGQLAQFVLNRELASGGNGLMTDQGLDALARCDEWRLRPIPALVGDGGSPNTSDSVTVFYSNSPTIVHAASFGGTGASPSPLPVISPNGFKINDWVIATETAAAATNCALVQVTGITQYPSLNPYPPADVGGTIALSYTFKAGTTFDHSTGSRAINLGSQVTRTTYSVNAAKQQLDSTDANPGLAVAATPVPVAQNIVLLKAQYGIDTDADPLHLVDCWTSADNSNTCGNGVDYSIASFQAVPAPAANSARIRTIKAIRIAIVVRSEDDVKQDISAGNANGKLQNQTAWLFNCAANNATCQGRMQINNTVLNDFRRYRIYEATIPLRNSIWHPL
ncbi:MAG: PilW family protein [Betaproteobacteria bacterium]